MKHDTLLEFALTTHCQAKCRSCARTDLETGEKVEWLKLQHFPLDTYLNILKSTQQNITQVKFCGEFGDPLMHPQIMQFVIETFKFNRHMEIDINTNGGLRKPAFYRELAANFPPSIYVNFGIDGTDHDTNWKYREGVDFERAMENMRTYTKWGGAGAWHFIIFDWNWHQIPEAAKIAKEIGIPIKFKFNVRKFGLITDKNKRKAVKLLEEINEVSD